MSGAEGNHERKRKPATPIWRQLYTQSSSHDANAVVVESDRSQNLDDGDKSAIGSQVHQVHYNVSGHIVTSQHAHSEAEVENETADPNICPASSQDNDSIKAPFVGSMHSTDEHSVSLQVGASLTRLIQRKWGSALNNLKEEMGVGIAFPSLKEDECLTIQGSSSDSVARASQRLQRLIDEVVKSQHLDYSHFVSLPLAIHPELVDKLVKFQNSLLGIHHSNQCENLSSDPDRDTSDGESGNLQSDKEPEVAVRLKAHSDNDHVEVDILNVPVVSYPPKESTSSTLETKTANLSELGIEKSIFIKPKTFHLTVLMLKLWNKDQVDAASEILRSVSAKVVDALEGRPVYVRLKGLKCMRGSLSRAYVLYAPVEEVGGDCRLMRACKVIIDEFVKGGLVLEKDARQTLKLHATVMNARHRKRSGRTKRLDAFDARGIVKQHGSEEWGEYLIREAHLSQRFVFDENGYYRCCASIPFPSTCK